MLKLRDLNLTLNVLVDNYSEYYVKVKIYFFDF